MKTEDVRINHRVRYFPYPDAIPEDGDIVAVGYREGMVFVEYDRDIPGHAKLTPLDKLEYLGSGERND